MLISTQQRESLNSASYQQFALRNNQAEQQLNTGVSLSRYHWHQLAT